MTKDQLEILLKAKSIMEEQAVDAIAFLKNEDVHYAVSTLHRLYIISTTNNSIKSAKILLKGLTRYFEKVRHKDMKALILIAMATDHVYNEEFNQAIALYYEYKKLDLVDAKLDYHFDLIIFEILYTNHVISRFSLFAQRIENNPYLYEIDPYYTIRFYYRCAVFAIQTSNRRELNKNIESIKRVMQSMRPSIYTNRSQLTLELLILVEDDYMVRDTNNYSKTLDHHKEISETYVEFDEFMLENIEVQIFLLQSFVRNQEYEYVIQRIKRLLSLSTSKRKRILLMRLLVTCYQETDSILYIDTVLSLNQLLTRYLSNYQTIINEGLLTSLKFYDIERDYIEIQSLYECDLLTKAYSRNVLFKKIHETLQKNKKLALIFFDLDNLKQVNDNYSHSTGDQLLRSFAEGIKTYLHPDDLLFRYGGDEFVVASLTLDKGRLSQILDKLTEHFKEPLRLENQEIYVKFSAGVAFYPEHGSSTEEVLRAADQAMYLAKRRGGGYEFCRSSKKQSCKIKTKKNCKD